MASPPESLEWTFDFSGGELCLDFANTVSGFHAAGDKRRDHLGAYPDLVSWGRQAGIVTDAEARRLLLEARRRPVEAERALRDAVALRECLFGVFLAFARGDEPRQRDLDHVNASLKDALSHRRIERREGGFALAFEDSGALDSMLWPVVASAAELLVDGGALARVRVCGLYDTRECAWLFVDRTKSGTRRWCSMKDCGNRAKARRHYQRARGDSA